MGHKNKMYTFGPWIEPWGVPVVLLHTIEFFEVTKKTPHAFLKQQ